MAVKLVSVKCPECGAMLDIEEGRDQAFCTHCGAKVVLLMRMNISTDMWMRQK